MTGVMAPLVQGEQKRNVIFALGAYTGGVIAAVACVGLLLGAAGFLVQAVVPTPAAVTVVAGVGVLLVILDTRSQPFAAVTLMRQTCPAWYQSLPSPAAFGLWGFDLGLGFSTIRVSSLYWVVAAAIVALVPPSMALLLVAPYGLALATWLWISSCRSKRLVDLHAPALKALAGRRVAKVASVVAMSALTITITATALADALS